MSRIEALAAVERLQTLVGPGFHPDTDPIQYLHDDGRPVFAMSAVDYWRGVLEAAYQALGDEIYEVCLERQRAALQPLDAESLGRVVANLQAAGWRLGFRVMNPANPHVRFARDGRRFVLTAATWAKALTLEAEAAGLCHVQG